MYNLLYLLCVDCCVCMCTHVCIDHVAIQALMWVISQCLCAGFTALCLFCSNVLCTFIHFCWSCKAQCAHPSQIIWCYRNDCHFFIVFIVVVVNVIIFSGWYEINLDKRKLRTPAGNIFRVPNEALALAVATEWNGQEKLVKRHKMHLVSFVVK